jgi:hypothetical protein
VIAPKPFSEFTPSEYREYVRGLYFKKLPKKSAKKVLPEVSWGRTKKNSLTLRIKRKPKSITQAEFTLIATESLTPLNELFMYLKKKKILLQG